MELTTQQLSDKIKDIVGKAMSERREESIAKGKEAGAAAAAGKTPDGKDADPVSRRHVSYLVDQPQSAAKKMYEKEPEDLTSDEKGRGVARCVRYLYRCQGNVLQAVELAYQAGDTVLAKYWEKALGQNTLAGGGALIPPEFAAGVIEELGAKSVVMASGVSTVPMNNGNLSIPFIDSSATAAYVAEGANATKSEATFGQLQLHDRELVALVPVGNRLLLNGSPRVDGIIRDHLVRIMKRKMDVTLIRSDGTAGEPKGMLFWAKTANKFDANGTINLANVTDDLGTCISNLEEGDVDLDNKPGWLFAPRTKKYLFTVRDTNNNLAFEPEMKGGTLMGFPWKMTSQIPKTLGSGSDESEIYFAAFDMLVLAENENIAVDAFAGGAYHDGSAIQSGISRNETVMRAIALHDFGAQQRGAEISVMEAVKLGA